MTYREPTTPAPEAPRPKGTPEDPHPYDYGDRRCPKCGTRLLFGPTKRFFSPSTLLVEHSRIGIGQDCIWYTHTYEDREIEPSEEPVSKWDHQCLRTEVYVGRFFLAVAVLGGLAHYCFYHYRF